MRDSLIFSPKNCTASSLERRIKNTSCIRRCSPPQIRLTMYGAAHAGACGPFLIASSKVDLDHSGPVLAGIPSSM